MIDRNPEPLGDQLVAVADHSFWKTSPGGPPTYNGVFHDILLSRYPEGLLPIADVLREDFPNLSTFQRSVAKEAKRRRELLSEE